MRLEKQLPFAHLILENEGKFNAGSLQAFNDCLDEALADESVQALMITGEDKIFAQGLDLEYLTNEQPDAAMAFVHNCMRAVGRLLAFPVPVVSAVNGHAFGLGAMITLASDYAVMRRDRGYFCLPEIDLGMNLIPSMNALVCAKLDGRNLRDVLLTGKRVGGDEAVARGIVDASCAMAELLDVGAGLA